MKKWYKECPYCKNEIKEWAIKCQYCKEFLDDEVEEQESEWWYRISKPMEKEYVWKRNKTTTESSYQSNYNYNTESKAEYHSYVKGNSTNYRKNFKNFCKKAWDWICRIFYFCFFCAIVWWIILSIRDSWKHSDSPKTPDPIYVEKNSSNDNMSYKNKDELNNDNYVEVERVYTAPENWTIIYKNYSFFSNGWSAALTIDNTRSITDSIFKLVPLAMEKSVYTVYIRAWEKVTLEDIPAGYYKEYFANSRWVDQVWEYDMYNPQQLWTSASEYTDWYERTISLYSTYNWNITTKDIRDSTFEDL